MSYLYHLFIFNPLYNALIYLMDVFPWIDAGFAVIILTIIVRLILFPLSKKAIVTQVRMKEIEPELNRLKQTVTDKQQQALKVMALYKEKGVQVPDNRAFSATNSVVPQVTPTAVAVPVTPAVSQAK